MDHYANAWTTNNEIPEVQKTISGLIYQKGLDENIIIPFLKSDYSGCGGSAWSDKGALNFPGPFYTGETDTCGTGITEAPNNVIFDEHCSEYIMIQPRTHKELLQVWNASAVEVFDGYYCDGNKHWTVLLVKNWWSLKADILEYLKNEELIKKNCNQEKRYAHYLENQAEMDLRKYCFFLEHGFYPTNEKLPELY